MDEVVSDGVLIDFRGTDPATALKQHVEVQTALDWLFASSADNWNGGFNAHI